MPFQSSIFNGLEYFPPFGGNLMCFVLAVLVLIECLLCLEVYDVDVVSTQYE